MTKKATTCKISCSKYQRRVVHEDGQSLVCHDRSCRRTTVPSMSGRYFAKKMLKLKA